MTRYLENITLEQARSVRDNFDYLKTQVAPPTNLDYLVLGLKNLTRDRSMPKREHLLECADLVYEAEMNLLGLDFDGILSGFESDVDPRVPRLVQVIEAYLARKEESTDYNFKKEF